MKILANENFPLPSARYLRTQGYDVTYIGEDCFGISDEEVLQKAINEERIIITFDRDYGELVFKKGFKPKMGIIYLRIFKYTPEQPGVIIKNLLSQNINFENCLSVFDGEHLRQKKYQP